MYQTDPYVFSHERRQTLESLPIAFAAYQYIGGKIITLLVSDGLCKMTGRARAELTQRFDNDMFGSVHPDDVEILAKLGYEFATKESPYDVIYRTRLFGCGDCHSIHAVGSYQTMETGCHVAFIVYTDITNTPLHQSLAVSLTESPKSRFFDEAMGAMAVVSRADKRLLYFNKALLRLLPPQVCYDSGITFNRFFFGENSAGTGEIFYAADLGPRVFETPLTQRKLEVNVVSTVYGEEPAYAVYVSSYAGAGSPLDKEAAARLKYASFNAVMFSGESNSLPYHCNRYRGFRVWNLTADAMVLDAGCKQFYEACAVPITFDRCIAHITKLCCDETQSATLASCSRERLLMLFESGTYPRQVLLTLQTEFGRIYGSLSFTMMREPDGGDVFLKVEERNITDKTILNRLIEKTVEQEYDFVAYTDLDSDRCHVISGKNAVRGQKGYVVQPTDYITSPADIRSMPALFPSSVHTLAEMQIYLMEACKAEGHFTTLQELPGGVIKSVYVEQVDPGRRTFFIRCKDVSALLRCERERKNKLEEAVRTEHDKVERVLVQTMLSVSNALDARDPLTSRHSQRVAQYSAEIARRIGWPESRAQNLYHIALVHDIGKIGIPDALLQKKGRLTHEEYLQIQKHVSIGSYILKDFSAVDKVSEGALFHHERYDGKGYPRGLPGEDIPIEARIIALADAVDAMNSTRPYRARQSEAYIRSELASQRGKQFDPALVDIMLRMIDEGLLDV